MNFHQMLLDRRSGTYCTVVSYEQRDAPPRDNKCGYIGGATDVSRAKATGDDCLKALSRYFDPKEKAITEATGGRSCMKAAGAAFATIAEHNRKSLPFPAPVF